MTNGWHPAAATSSGRSTITGGKHQIEPAVVIPMISTLEWDGTPWSGEAYGQSFTLNTDDTNPSDWVYGDLPTGYWQITPDATFQSGSDTCQVKLATPVQFVDLAVSSLTWESAAPGGGADYDISKGKLFVDGNLPVDHQVTVDVRTSPPLPPGWSANLYARVFDPANALSGGFPGDNYAGFSMGGDIGTAMSPTSAGPVPVSSFQLNLLTSPACNVTHLGPFTVNAPNPGNNFIVAVGNSAGALRAVDRFPRWTDH